LVIKRRLKSYFKQIVELGQNEKAPANDAEAFSNLFLGVSVLSGRNWCLLGPSFHWDNYFFLKYWSKKLEVD
jgi:hypothetical protein